MFLRKNNLASNKVPDHFDLLLLLSFSWLNPLNPMIFTLGRFIEPQTEEDVGLLVQVSFYITAFTLPAYQRGSLPRPSKDDSS